jgi:hypothetical protein
MVIDPFAPIASQNADDAPLNYFADAGVSRGVLNRLEATKPWVRLISVMVFLGVIAVWVLGLMLLLGGDGTFNSAFKAGYSTSAGGAVKPELQDTAVTGVFIATVATPMLLALLFVYPALKLWKYASRIQHLLKQVSSANLEAVLREQLSFWKVIGIIILGVVLLSFLSGVVLVAIDGLTAMRTRG